MDRLAAVEQRMQFAAKFRIAEIVAQKKCVQQFPKLIGRPVQPVSLRSTAKPLKRDGRAHASRPD